MKWSLTGWSDWTYCVQSAMSEVGLKGERAVCDEAPPIYPALLGARSSEREIKAEKSQARASMSWMGLVHVAFGCGPGPCVHPLPYWPFLVTSPMELSLGLQKARKERLYLLTTSLLGPSHARGFPTAAPNARLSCLFAIATTGNSPLLLPEMLATGCMKISWLELPRAGLCSLMQSYLWAILASAKH